MLRRSLLRRELQYSKPPNAKGSRPRAADREPFVPVDPLPKKHRNALEKKHYLAAHDALRAKSPKATVQAFITDKSSYGFDMLCLLPDEKRQVTSLDIYEAVHDFKARMEHFGVPVTGSTRCSVHFHDQSEMVVGFGVQGVTFREINAQRTWAGREVLRTSLNCDTERWEEDWSFAFKDMVDRLQSKNEEIFDKELVQFPRHYWAAHVHWAQHRILEEGVDLYMYVLESFFNVLHKPLPHPVLLDENLHTLGIALDLAEAARPTQIMASTLDTDVFEKLPLGVDTDDPDGHAQYQAKLDVESHKAYLARQRLQLEEEERAKQHPGAREYVQRFFDKFAFLDRVIEPKKRIKKPAMTASTSKPATPQEPAADNSAAEKTTAASTPT